jgi:hypothetical protein
MPATLALTFTPLSVAKSDVCLPLQSSTESYLGCFSDCPIRHIRPRHSGRLTTSGLGHSELFRRFFRTHNPKTPFKTHNSLAALNRFYRQCSGPEAVGAMAEQVAGPTLAIES